MSIQSEWGISNLTVKSLDAEKDIGTYECIVTSNGQKFVEKLTVTNILGKYLIKLHSEYSFDKIVT